MQNFRVEAVGLVFLRAASGRFDRPNYETIKGTRVAFEHHGSGTPKPLN